jgi:single-stranded DNA-binding protein
MNIGINQGIVMGTLSHSPVFYENENGTLIAIIYTNSLYTDKVGQFRKASYGHRVAFPKHLAARAKNFLVKGVPIHINAILQTEKIMDSKGEVRFTTTLFVRNFALLNKENNAILYFDEDGLN